MSYDEKTFKKWDKNNDGVLDREEVQNLMKKAEVMSEAAYAADEMLTELDLDLNKTISMLEWAASLY